ncbi:hypothetical protein ACFY71_23780 [Streptomyces cinerochromogenes]|uniref:hypothetical protein n=1 Tax=Streptomyces cinerochromogenes TaxID=66422 RepID=UPI0036D00A02
MGSTRRRPASRDAVALARRAARARTADALFPPCTDLPAYDVLPRPEAGPRTPVISANPVTMWAAPRRLGTRAVGPCQALLDAAARAWSVLPEEQQEGWT